MPEKNAILVIDDNDFVRTQISLLLKAADFDVFEARDGNEALDIMASDKALALVIVDVRMEPVGGFDFIRDLRAGGTDIPVILVTGDQTPDLLEQAGKLGVAAVLMKPVEKARLLGTVERTFQHIRRAS